MTVVSKSNQADAFYAESWQLNAKCLWHIFDIFCHILLLSTLIKFISNFQCTQSNFLTEEKAALHWNVGTTRENPGKILCEQLVGIKTHNNIQRLEDWLNQFFHFLWRQISPENVRGQLNKKFAKLDEIRIGSGRDYKAWLICLFTVFTKTCLWHGNWFKLYSTTDVKNYEELWNWFLIIRTKNTFESDCIHINKTLGLCIQFA